jgi:hypothetical protein
MELNTVTAAATLEKIVKLYPVESLRKMPIEKYAHLTDRESFCYLLEYGSRDLGEVGGMPLTKFGLWRFNVAKEFEHYASDRTYAWDLKFGINRTQAFKNIINIVADIAEASLDGDWIKIQNIGFHAVAKWKIAFIYSNYRLFPVYTRESLLKIAAALGAYFKENAPIIELQEFITSKKPENQDMVAFAEFMWQHYVEGKPFRNYFVVGTKYAGGNGREAKDVFSSMLEFNCIATGFLWDFDLSDLVNGTDEEIDNFVAENSHGEDISLSHLQRYFRILLKLKPGDIVALKSTGSHSSLKIIAYAVVTEKNGKVYEYSPTKLGHHVHVEFVELDVNRPTDLNYAGTIHKVDPERVEHLKIIFGPFLQVDNLAIGDENEDESIVSENKDRVKSEESYVRGAIAARMVRQLHNIIQNDLFASLKKKYPNQDIKLEYENRVDIVRETADERWFYEIKPFENVVSCLRLASGQLIEYAFRFPEFGKKTHLVVVGPGVLTREADLFLDFFRESINLPLDYMQHTVPPRQDKFKE